MIKRGEDMSTTNINTYSDIPSTISELINYCKENDINPEELGFCLGSKSDKVGVLGVFYAPSGKIVAERLMSDRTRRLEMLNLSNKKLIYKLQNMILDAKFPNGDSLAPEVHTPGHDDAPQREPFSAYTRYALGAPHRTAPDYDTDILTLDELSRIITLRRKKLKQLGFYIHNPDNNQINGYEIKKNNDIYTVYKAKTPIYIGKSEEAAVKWMLYELDSSGVFWGGPSYPTGNISSNTIMQHAKVAEKTILKKILIILAIIGAAALFILLYNGRYL